VTAMDDIRDMIAGERGALAEVLASLPATRWDEPSLCAGWRVREVVAHITMPFRSQSAHHDKMPGSSRSCRSCRFSASRRRRPPPPAAPARPLPAVTM
jgi:uncharacterized protein (TIGR03083 family)